MYERAYGGGLAKSHIDDGAGYNEGLERQMENDQAARPIPHYGHYYRSILLVYRLDGYSLATRKCCTWLALKGFLGPISR